MDNHPANTMQTLQIYKKKEKISSDIRIRKMLNECESVRRSYIKDLTPIFMTTPCRKKQNDELKEENLLGEPQVKTIEFQDTLTKLEKELRFWVEDYRSLIAQVCEFERIIPSTNHVVEESDRKAQQNVNKIVKVEEIKDKLLAEFSNLCIRFEENDEKSRRKIKRLESQVLGSQAKIENLEFELEKQKKRTCF